MGTDTCCHRMAVSSQSTHFKMRTASALILMFCFLFYFMNTRVLLLMLFETVVLFALPCILLMLSAPFWRMADGRRDAECYITLRPPDAKSNKMQSIACLPGFAIETLDISLFSPLLVVCQGTSFMFYLTLTYCKCILIVSVTIQGNKFVANLVWSSRTKNLMKHYSLCSQQKYCHPLHLTYLWFYWLHSDFAAF